MRATILPLIASALVVMAGCVSKEANRHDLEADARTTSATAAVTVAAAPVATPPIILFAPVAMGPLATIYKEGSTEWAAGFASRLNVLNASYGMNLQARHNEHLPDATSSDWSKGRVRGTHTVDIVVLVKVLELSDVEGELTNQGRQKLAQAIVELTAIDREGGVLFKAQGKEQEIYADLPKFSGMVNDARVKAGRVAANAVLGRFQDFLRARGEHKISEPVGTIPVSITSDPPGADIIVDALYRGVTPATIKLAPKPTDIEITRPGYLPWKRTIMPNAAEPLHRELIRADSQK